MTLKKQQWWIPLKNIANSDMIFFDIAINTAQICMVFKAHNP